MAHHDHDDDDQDDDARQQRTTATTATTTATTNSTSKTATTTNDRERTADAGRLMTSDERWTVDDKTRTTGHETPSTQRGFRGGRRGFVATRVEATTAASRHGSAVLGATSRRPMVAPWSSQVGAVQLGAAGRSPGVVDRIHFASRVAQRPCPLASPPCAGACPPGPSAPRLGLGLAPGARVVSRARDGPTSCW